MGSTSSSTTCDEQSPNERKRTSRSERNNKSFSYQMSNTTNNNKKIQITQETIKEILTNIHNLIQAQQISLNKALHDIESKLNQEFIRSILVTLSMKQGRRQFLSDTTLNSMNYSDSMINNVIRQTLIEFLLPPFFDNFINESMNVRQMLSYEEKRVHLDQLKRDVQTYKTFCCKFFLIILKKVNLNFKTSVIHFKISELLLKPYSIEDLKVKNLAKEFIYSYYHVYSDSYSNQELLLKQYMTKLKIKETTNMSIIKRQLQQTQFYSQCQRRIQRLINISRESNYITISQELFDQIEQYNNQIFNLGKNYYSDGADSRQVLNINFILLFKYSTIRLYTYCNFMIDNFENSIEPSQKHLITTLNISFEKLIHYCQEQAETISNNNNKNGVNVQSSNTLTIASENSSSSSNNASVADQVNQTNNKNNNDTFQNNQSGQQVISEASQIFV